jgi:hypothetical protein
VFCRSDVSCTLSMEGIGFIVSCWYRLVWFVTMLALLRIAPSTRDAATIGGLHKTLSTLRAVFYSTRYFSALIILRKRV